MSKISCLLNKDITVKDIAKKLNISYYILKRYGISIRTISEAKKGIEYFAKYNKILTKDFLIKEYIINKKTIQTIAKENGCSTIPVYSRLIKHNIKKDKTC